MDKPGLIGTTGDRGPLSRAFDDLGVREVHPNRGPRIDVYHLRVGSPVPPDPTTPGLAWCCAAMYTWFHEAGRWFPRTASVKRFTELAAAHRLPPGEKPRQGDVGVHLRADGKGHITLLNLDKGSGWEDISGNTSPSGYREGQGVFLVTRPLIYYTGGFYRL